MDPDEGKNPDTSQLFLVRLWADATAGTEAQDAPESRTNQLHGKVMHVLSGKGSNFNDWPTLMTLLVKMMAPTNNDETATGREGATT